MRLKTAVRAQNVHRIYVRFFFQNSKYENSTKILRTLGGWVSISPVAIVSLADAKEEEGPILPQPPRVAGAIDDVLGQIAETVIKVFAMPTKKSI